ncbi:NtaA/DmoA family FMN-dependent monooxygenase [Kineococcus sp. T13]|uniref:NtaA/DmoA family FMN-dependent monooxygenase n=1 Tax=Kineococcus vitellinus TaxID=2696565 RepID=UPI00141314A7|nr:NtaA/DmoA family FMN-dependent monooxygenase [Kineococcus vitellinus]
MKRIGLGVFEVGGPQVGGTISWNHPRSRGREFLDLAHWVEMAQLLDRAGFDFLFFAGGPFTYPAVGGEISDALVQAGMGSGIDATHFVPSMAAATERLGFVLTSVTGANHPLFTVRTFQTLDHLTGGRIGWNIVTGSSQDTHAAMMGHREMVPHDTRYAIAREYVELALRYWEGSWEEGGLVLDAEKGVFADPAKLHRVVHEGEHYRSSGWLTSPPGPQGSPTLFQAGTSEAGREFAARYAECVFVQGSTPERTAANVADIRRRAAAHGRDPQAVKLFVGVTVVTAATEEEARRQRAEFDALQTDELAAAYYAGNTGVDLLSLDPDGTLHQLAERGSPAVGQLGVSNIERFLGPDAPTVRQVLDQLKGRGTRGFPFTGSGEQVAAQLEELVDATDLDGIMVEPVFDIASLEDVVEFVLPHLRERGRLEPAAGATMRERMVGGGARLAPTHPGAGMRPGG